MNVLATVLRKRRLAALFVLAIVSLPSLAPARTHVIPHVLDSSGRITNTPYTFDTTIFADYVGAVACVDGGLQDVPVEVYLYEDSGAPMRGFRGTEVCNPCLETIGAGHRKLSLSLDEKIVAAGGFNGVKMGFAVIVVGGADPENVAVQGFIVNSHTSAMDLAAFGFNPIEITSAKSGAALPCGRVFTTGHLMATPGTVGDPPYTYDTTLFMTYTAGLAGQPSGGGAAVDVYLFDEATGQPLADAVGTPVCYPCSVALDDAARKHAFSIGGHLPGGAVISAAVSAVCVVSGDAGNVAIQSLIVNRHTSAFDVSMTGAPLQEITSGAVAGLPAGLADRLGLRSYPNPFNPRTTFAWNLPDAGAVTVSVFDAQGALVRRLLSEGLAAGEHEVAWDGRADDGQPLPSGVYFGRIDSAGGSETQKVMLVK